MTIVEVDGTQVTVNKLSSKKDNSNTKKGIYSELDKGISHIIQPTELGDSLKELNDDTLNLKSRQSGIDMRARLHYVEVRNLLALDALVSLKVLPTDCLAFSRQKKRLSVSLEGKGRDDIVNIVSGKTNVEAKKAGFFKGFLGIGGDKNSDGQQ